MVGHGHDLKIPSPCRYKVENYPELLKYQQHLANEGLKDPWIRNDAWRFNPFFETTGKRALYLTRGWKLGVPAFLISIGIDQLMAFKNGHNDDNEHH